MEISYEGEKIRLTKADVLSLDIATHTGYHSIHGSGTWDFTEAKYRNNNKQHKDFRDTVMAFIKEHRIKQVVVEDVSAEASSLRYAMNSTSRSQSPLTPNQSKNGLPAMERQIKKR